MVTILCKILILPSFLLLILVWVLAAIYYFTCWALCQCRGSIDSTGKHTEHPTSFLMDYESSDKNENSFLQTLSPATRNADTNLAEEQCKLLGSLVWSRVCLKDRRALNCGLRFYESRQQAGDVSV